MVLKSSNAAPRGACPASPPPTAKPGILIQIVNFILAYYQTIFIIVLTFLATLGAVYVAHTVSSLRFTFVSWISVRLNHVKVVKFLMFRCHFFVYGNMKFTVKDSIFSACLHNCQSR